MGRRIRVRTAEDESLRSRINSANNAGSQGVLVASEAGAGGVLRGLNDMIRCVTLPPSVCTGNQEEKHFFTIPSFTFLMRIPSTPLFAKSPKLIISPRV